MDKHLAKPVYPPLFQSGAIRSWIICRFVTIICLFLMLLKLCCTYISLVMGKPTLWFQTWSGTNQAAQQPQKTARGLKFRIKKVEELYCVAKSMAQISLGNTLQLICVFVFAYAQCWFTHDAAHVFSYHI